VNRVKWIFMILMAAVFSIAMKLLGALLITALLIIPASSARQISKTPESMVVFACLFGVLSVALGILLSSFWDFPTGPSIVAVSFGLFLLSLIFPLFQKGLRG
jgi:zinc transport system permease protein